MSFLEPIPIGTNNNLLIFGYIYIYTHIQKLGVGKKLEVLKKSILCSPRLHFLTKNYNMIMKYQENTVIQNIIVV